MGTCAICGASTARLFCSEPCDAASREIGARAAGWVVVERVEHTGRAVYPYRVIAFQHCEGGIGRGPVSWDVPASSLGWSGFDFFSRAVGGVS